MDIKSEGGIFAVKLEGHDNATINRAATSRIQGYATTGELTIETQDVNESIFAVVTLLDRLKSNGPPLSLSQLEGETGWTVSMGEAGCTVLEADEAQLLGDTLSYYAGDTSTAAGQSNHPLLRAQEGFRAKEMAEQITAQINRSGTIT